MAKTTCSKCGGTGYIAQFAHVDGGKCWKCTGLADTSYTSAIETMTAEEVAANWERICAERKAARQARRAAK